MFDISLRIWFLIIGLIFSLLYYVDKMPLERYIGVIALLITFEVIKSAFIYVSEGGK